MKALLTTKALLVGYGGAALVPPIDISIGAGELWIVLGRNGSGKTTLFKTLLGLHAPVGGEIIAHPSFRPAYVPQRNSLDPIVPLRVNELVAMGCERGLSFLSRRSRKAAVAEALEHAGASELSGARFSDLSEGQKQRVLLARLLASEADIAFLDEPTAAMDAVAEDETLRTLARFRDENNMALVMVTHFLGSARRYADKVLFMDSDLGVAIAGAPETVFNSEQFRARYGEIGDA